MGREKQASKARLLPSKIRPVFQPQAAEEDFPYLSQYTDFWKSQKAPRKIRKLR